MRLFNKSKKESNTFEEISRSMGNELIELYSKENNVSFEQTTELERQY